MKRLLIAPAAVAATLALAACGSGGSTSGTTSSPASAASGGASGKTVSVSQASGSGRVLVDSSGMALYTPDQDANGKPHCDGACTSFWKPLQAKGGMPSAASGVGKLATVKRSDGTMQVTVSGKPLYTFTEDSPGNVKGDGFKDTFDGQQFTWHVVRAGGTSSSSSSAGGSSGSSSQSSGGGYSY